MFYKLARPILISAPYERLVFDDQDHQRAALPISPAHLAGGRARSFPKPVHRTDRRVDADRQTRAAGEPPASEGKRHLARPRWRCSGSRTITAGGSIASGTAISTRSRSLRQSPSWKRESPLKRAKGRRAVSWLLGTVRAMSLRPQTLNLLLIHQRAKDLKLRRRNRLGQK